MRVENVGTFADTLRQTSPEALSPLALCVSSLVPAPGLELETGAYSHQLGL